MSPAVHQRPVDIGVDVGREAEEPARLQHPGKAVQIDFGHEASLPVLLLRPGIGIEKIDLIE